jgi:hypothetical protein
MTMQFSKQLKPENFVTVCSKSELKDNSHSNLFQHHVIILTKMSFEFLTLCYSKWI